MTLLDEACDLLREALPAVAGEARDEARWASADPELACHDWRDMRDRIRAFLARVAEAGDVEAGDVEARTVEIDEVALTQAHLAVENVLVEFRDSRLSIMGRGNGLVIREKDGTESSVMRLGTRDGLRIGIKAYLEHRRPK